MENIENIEKNNEDQPYVDPNEIKRPTSFVKWIENFWYHYKWHTIITLFFAVLLVVLIVQIVGREEYDISAIYSGPVQLDGGDLEKISSAFAEIIDEDYNGDGKINVLTHDEYILSPEQQKELEDEADRLNDELSQESDEGGKKGEYVFIYTTQDRSAALNNVTTLVTTGEAIICLMDKYTYDIFDDNDAFADLTDILGYTPEYALDEHSVYLKDTDFGKYFKSAFDLLPDDTILCIRKKATVGVSRDFDDVYSAHIEVFNRIFEFKIPK